MRRGSDWRHNGLLSPEGPSETCGAGVGFRRLVIGGRGKNPMTLEGEGVRCLETRTGITIKQIKNNQQKPWIFLTKIDCKLAKLQASRVGATDPKGVVQRWKRRSGLDVIWST